VVIEDKLPVVVPVPDKVIELTFGKAPKVDVPLFAARESVSKAPKLNPAGSNVKAEAVVAVKEVSFGVTSFNVPAVPPLVTVAVVAIAASTTAVDANVPSAVIVKEVALAAVTVLPKDARSVPPLSLLVATVTLTEVALLAEIAPV